MASKKYLLLAGLLCFIFSSAFSQSVGSSYDVKDTTLIPSKRMPLHSQFLEGSYNFPAKPRNQWEVGFSLGTFNISGDVPTRFTFPSFALHVRKALGYIFSLRMQYLYGSGKGQSWQAAANYYKNTAWQNNGYVAPVLMGDATLTSNVVRYFNSQTLAPLTAITQIDPIFYNYKTVTQDLGVQGVITLNQIRFHKSKTSFVAYLFGGIGATIYETKVNALNDAGAKYNFRNIFAAAYPERKQALDALKDLMDDSYETPAENASNRRPKFAGSTLRPSGTVGAGMAFKLSNKLNLALEDRITIVKDDLLDGQRWQEAAVGDPVMTADKELITPTYCQPADADGIGKCPCPDSSCFPKPVIVGGGSCAEKLGQLPSVTFAKGNSLDDDAKAALSTVASRMRNNAGCKVVVIGYCSSNKKEQQLSWDHVNAVITYLVEKEGISQDRLIFNYGQEGGDCNTVDLQAAEADDSRPNTVPAPHPNLRKN